MHDPNYDDSSEGETPSDTAPEEAKDSDSTGLLPKAFFGDKELKVGNECKVRIEKVYDDQVAVSYVPHNESKSEEASESKPEEASEPSSEPGTSDNMYA